MIPGVLVGLLGLVVAAPVPLAAQDGARVSGAHAADAGAPAGGADPRAAFADTLELARLHEAALRYDARARQADINRTALELRLRSLAGEWLPRLRLRGEARHQSDAPRIDAAAGFPDVPKDRYEAALGVEQVVYDGTIAGRRGVERARTAEAQAHLAGELHELRAEVDAAFFAGLAASARRAEIVLLIDDLEARLAQARSGVEAGARLPGDAAALEAEVLRARQRRDEFEADRRAALSVLSGLTGLPIAGDAVLAAPDLEAEVSAVRARVGRSRQGAERGLRDHPLFEAFRRTSDRLGHEADVAERARLPRLVAFGEAGYGRPGLNQFGDAWDTFWLGGVRLEWAPWNWGRVGREAELVELRRRTVDTEREAFAAGLERAVADHVADFDRLEAAIASDERIVRLREQVERQEARRFEEGVITAADYVEARTDVERARVTRRLHHIELAATRARYLTVLGVPIR